MKKPEILLLLFVLLISGFAFAQEEEPDFPRYRPVETTPYDAGQTGISEAQALPPPVYREPDRSEPDRGASSQRAFTLYFSGNSTTLTGRSISASDRAETLNTVRTIGDIMKRNPEAHLLIEGFANPSGSSQAEERELRTVSLARANAAADLVAAEGIPKSRMIVTGRGSAGTAVTPNQSGKSQNRRADLAILLPESREILPFASNEAALIGARLSPSARVTILNKIIKIAEVLKNDTRARLLVTGYANPVVGTTRELQETLIPLSRQRAAEAAEMIVLEGVDRGRIITVGAGPVPASRRSRNAAENRFVEMIILK
jgi:outer membrane protein OmpA-like peptidoglycan-associated protein